MPAPIRIALTAVSAALVLHAQSPDRFNLPLFHNDMRPFAASDAAIKTALENAAETPGCHYHSFLRGSFTEPEKREAVVNTGCGESHADSYGSTVLLSQQADGQWRIRWREPGLITRACTRFVYSDRRDGLLCFDTDAHQGEREQYLYTVDLAKPPGSRMTMLLLIADTMRAGWEKSTEANLERIDPGPPLIVILRHGTASLPEDVREKNMLAEGPPPHINTQQYRLEYSFDGTRFVPTDDTVRSLKAISEQ